MTSFSSAFEGDVDLLLVHAAPGPCLCVERCGAHPSGLRPEKPHQLGNLVEIALVHRRVEHHRQRQPPAPVDIGGTQRIELDFAPISFELLRGIDMESHVHVTGGGQMLM